MYVPGESGNRMDLMSIRSQIPVSSSDVALKKEGIGWEHGGNGWERVGKWKQMGKHQVELEKVESIISPPGLSIS